MISLLDKCILDEHACLWPTLITCFGHDILFDKEQGAALCLENNAGFSVVQYEAQIDAIVEQAQYVGQPEEGLWCCTIV